MPAKHFLSLPPRRWLLITAAVLLVFRLVLSALVPMTGDEAYFIFWGEHPAGGYYDHPPMAGWWLTALLAVSRAEWWLRLPSTLMPFFLAAMLWHCVRQSAGVGSPGTGGEEERTQRADFVALLVLLQPAGVWNVLFTTDTPLPPFALLSMLAYVAALRSPAIFSSLAWHAAAGLFLGLAFLSKYFAALLGFAYLAHVISAQRAAARTGGNGGDGGTDGGTIRRWTGFAALVAVALLAPAYNLWWNSGHCWTNLLFNFMNRNTDAGFSWTNPLLYVVSVLYLALPFLCWELWRARREVAERMKSNMTVGVAFYFAAIPLLLYALMSLQKTIGLHWLLAFTPFLALLAALTLPLSALTRVLRAAIPFAILHIVLFAAIFVFPLSTWQSLPLYKGIVFTVRTPQLLQAAMPHLERCGGGRAENCILASNSYSAAVTLAYAADRHVPVFGEGSRYARQDDAVTDYRAFAGRNFLILRRTPSPPGEYDAYFARTESAQVAIEGVPFYLVTGYSFAYEPYREHVLSRVRERYYHIPSWLPGSCPFCERYFPETPRCY